MMSASTMMFPNVVPNAATAGATAETAVADGADFNAALAALAAAPATPATAGKPEPPLPVADAEEDVADTVLDAEAVAALLAGMLPAAAPTPASAAAAELPVMPAEGDSLDAAAVVEAAGSLAGSMPGAEAAAAAAAAALPAAAGPALPGQAGTDEAAASQGQSPAAVHLPSHAAKSAAELPQLPATAQAKDVLPSQGTAAVPAAAVPATQVSASAVVSSLPAARTGLPRETAGTRAVDAKAATQTLRNLMQAMGWSSGASTDAAAGPATTSAAAIAPGAPQVLPDGQPLIPARGQDGAEALNPQPQPDALEAPTPSSTPALTQANPPVVATTAAGAEQAVRSAVGTPRWAQELGNQLVLMNARGQQEGSLTLTPEHLGPLEVRITVSQNTANVWFGAQHADTRAALTEAMPRLRELFSDAGLSLGHAGVSQEAPRQDRREAGPQDFAGLNAAEAAAKERDLPATVHRLSRGLLDTYA